MSVQDGARLNIKRAEMRCMDEQFIKKCFGKQDHFCVPKGYFDNLSLRILDNIGLMKLTADSR